MSVAGLLSAGLPAFAAEVGAALLIGALLGAIYFLPLLWIVRRLAGGPAVMPLLLHAIRFVLLAVALAAIARTSGAVVLLAVAVGLLLARAAVLRLGAPS